jgi:Putative prokaryotic signal transducing protein
VTPILKTTNPTVLSFVETLLKGEGIPVFVLDANISATEGSIGIFPRRLAVADADAGRAREILRDAGLDHEIAG